jgi:hypothetical protein
MSHSFPPLPPLYNRTRSTALLLERREGRGRRERREGVFEKGQEIKEEGGAWGIHRNMDTPH